MKKKELIDKFDKKMGSGILLNQKAAEYFLIVNSIGTVGLLKEDYLDNIEYRYILMGTIPKNKHFAVYEDYGYNMNYIRDVVGLISPNEYGFHVDTDSSKILVFKNGTNRIAIAPNLDDWEALTTISLTDLFKPRPSSVLII